jgi:hypothetical protein
MRTLSAYSVLDLWEQASSRTPVERALAMLAAASPETSPAQLAALTVGECEAALLALHEATFGSRLDGFAECPRCGEALEVGVSIAELRVAFADVSPVHAEVLVHGDYEVHFQTLTQADLAAAGRCASVADARALLLDRSIVSAVRLGKRVGSARLPRGVVERLAERLAACDPWAESLLDLSCPACRHQWTVLLDVAVFLWTAIRARAQRLLRDVHALASAYGWREADILAMSSRRREAYLELVGA